MRLYSMHTVEMKTGATQAPVFIADPAYLISLSAQGTRKGLPSEAAIAPMTQNTK